MRRSLEWKTQLSEDKRFNDQVFTKTAGWTYAVKETQKLIKENNGVFLDNLICNKEETLKRMADAWDGPILEESLEFLVLEEFLHCIQNPADKKIAWCPDFKGFISNLTAGNYEESFYTNASGPRNSDLFSFLRFRGHDIKSSRELNKILLPVRDQIYEFTGKSHKWSREIRNHNCLAFGLRLFPIFCLESIFSSDFTLIVQKMCNWMVKSKEPELLWRLDFILFKSKYLDYSYNKLSRSIDWGELGGNAWMHIKKTWSSSLIEDLGEEVFLDRRNDYECLHSEAIEESVRMGETFYLFDVVGCYLGFYHSSSCHRICGDEAKGIELLEKLISAKGDRYELALLYLGLFYLGYDAEQMSGVSEFVSFGKTKENHPFYNLSKGIEFLERSVNCGLNQAKYWMGKLYLQDDFALKNIELGLNLLNEVASSRLDFEKTHYKEGNRPPLHSDANKSLGWHFAQIDEDKASKHFTEAIQGGDWELGLDLLKMFFNGINSKNKTDSDLLSVTEKFLLETLNSMLKIEGRGGVSFESSIKFLTNDIVGQKRPRESAPL